MAKTAKLTAENYALASFLCHPVQCSHADHDDADPTAHAGVGIGLYM